ncbi:hypothetical protein LOTGIDRAFT_153910 [Lottia gigantea]|uniref:Uncharacterized protein n=1 Tax=Lottia gigantea TaxID=225164 RepID=V4ADS0_LOTGI|nr:hypothetical protein LOTGIDRAFT_153910 [Lottia gigantea]ESO91466.1 hypothetical protein LOTGIDRAFT_153910 [Lottia gigantea]
MVLEAGSYPIETIKHPGEFDTMLKTVLYPKNYDSVSGWIPDVGDGEVLKEPVRTVANDTDLDRIRVVARNTLERVTRGVNHGFEKRALQQCCREQQMGQLRKLEVVSFIWSLGTQKGFHRFAV